MSRRQKSKSNPIADAVSRAIAAAEAPQRQLPLEGLAAACCYEIGAKSGSFHLTLADCAVDVTQGDEKIGSVRAAVGGSLEISFGSIDKDGCIYSLSLIDVFKVAYAAHKAHLAALASAPSAPSAPSASITSPKHPLNLNLNGKLVAVVDFSVAVCVWNRARDEHGWNSSHLKRHAGEITDANGKVVARVAYNGRLFEPDDRTPIELDVCVEGERE